MQRGSCPDTIPGHLHRKHTTSQGHGIGLGEERASTLAAFHASHSCSEHRAKLRAHSTTPSWSLSQHLLLNRYRACSPADLAGSVSKERANSPSLWCVWCKELSPPPPHKADTDISFYQQGTASLQAHMGYTHPDDYGKQIHGPRPSKCSGRWPPPSSMAGAPS